MNTHDVLAAIEQLQFSIGEYILMGGSSLAVRGLRDTKDLDILVTPTLYNKLAKTWPSDPEYFRKWNRVRLKKDQVEIYPDFYWEKANYFEDTAALISSAEIVNNIPIQKLDHLIAAKKDNSREKDLLDIVLMENYLKILFTGLIVRESLVDEMTINPFIILDERHEDSWHICRVQGNHQQISELTSHLKQGWYAHFWNDQQMIVIYPERMFVFSHDPNDTIRQQAVNYGRSTGILLEELDFRIS